MPELAVVLAGAAAAAFAAGLAGFADALIASAIWLHVLAPVDAVPLIMASGVVIHSLSVPQLSARTPRKVFVPLLLAGLAGVPLGAAMLAIIDPRPFRVSIAVLLLAYCALALLRPHATTPGGAGPLPAAGVGLAGGVLGGFCGLSGLLPTLWSGWCGFDRHTRRAIYQPFILVTHAAGLAWLLWQDRVGPEVWRLAPWCLPALGAGLWLGHRCYGHVSETVFRRLVLLLLACSGVSLLL